MPHLPETDSHQDQRLDNGPPQDSLVGALAGLSEALLSVLKKEDRTLYTTASVIQDIYTHGGVQATPSSSYFYMYISDI